jgi:hypothetical protein
MTVTRTELSDLAAPTGMLVIGPLAVGLVLVAALIGAVWWGSRRRRRQPPPPRPEEQPRLPDGGPVHEVREHREPQQVPRSDERLTPHQLGTPGSAATGPNPAEERPRWEQDGGGSFGSGGPGPT